MLKIKEGSGASEAAPLPIGNNAVGARPVAMVLNAQRLG
jgi:hypothetical protein